MSRLLEQIADLMEQAVVKGNAAFDAAKKGAPEDLIRLYVATDESYDRLDKARKELYAMLEGVSRNYIPEVLAERQIKTISLDDIKRRITVAVRISASIVPDNKALAFQWLRDNKADALIQETVNAGTLSSFAKQRLEEGYELPEELFKMNTMQYTSVTKIK